MIGARPSTRDDLSSFDDCLHPSGASALKHLRSAKNRKMGRKGSSPKECAQPCEILPVRTVVSLRPMDSFPPRTKDPHSLSPGKAETAVRWTSGGAAMKNRNYGRVSRGKRGSGRELRSHATRTRKARPTSGQSLLGTGPFNGRSKRHHAKVPSVRRRFSLGSRSQAILIRTAKRIRPFSVTGGDPEG